MVKEAQEEVFVRCAVCHKMHAETPLPREHNEFDARDWTYYREFHKGEYIVVCKKEHDAMLAPKGEAVQ